MARAHYRYCHAPKDGRQTLVYGVWTDAGYRLAWINVDVDWLHAEASLNDLKALAIAEVEACSS